MWLTLAQTLELCGGGITDRSDRGGSLKFVVVDGGCGTASEGIQARIVEEVKDLEIFQFTLSRGMGGDWFEGGSGSVRGEVAEIVADSEQGD